MGSLSRKYNRLSVRGKEGENQVLLKPSAANRQKEGGLKNLIRTGGKTKSRSDR